MADVFISFIHEETQPATAVRNFVTNCFNNTVSVFLSSDRWSILPGQKWLGRIHEELTPAKVMLCMLSPRSIDRPWVNFEAGAAWGHNIPIIPVCFNGCQKGSLGRFWSEFQSVELPVRREAERLIGGISEILCGQLHASPIWACVKQHFPSLQSEMRADPDELEKYDL